MKNVQKSDSRTNDNSETENQMNWILLIRKTDEGYELNELLQDEREIICAREIFNVSPDLIEIGLQEFRKIAIKDPTADMIPYLLANGSERGKSLAKKYKEYLEKKESLEILRKPAKEESEQFLYQYFLKNPKDHRFDYYSKATKSMITVEFMVYPKRKIQ